MKKRVREFEEFMNNAREELLDFARKKIEDETRRIINLNLSDGLKEKNLKDLVDDILKYIPENMLIKHTNFTETTLQTELFEYLKSFKKVEQVENYFIEIVQKIFDEKVKEFRDDIYSIIKVLTLRQFDVKWVDHLELMKDLREGVRLQGYAQKNPLVEYKNKAFEVFNSFILSINSEVAKSLLKVRKVEARNSSLAKALITNREQIEDVVTGDREMEVGDTSLLKDQKFKRLQNNKTHLNVTKKVNKTYGRNDKVSVKYEDGKVLENVKYKKVMEDVENGRATII